MRGNSDLCLRNSVTKTELVNPKYKKTNNWDDLRSFELNIFENFA